MSEGEYSVNYRSSIVALTRQEKKKKKTQQSAKIVHTKQVTAL